MSLGNGIGSDGDPHATAGALHAVTDHSRESVRTVASRPRYHVRSRSRPRPAVKDTSDDDTAVPLVSCIMPTFDRRPFLPDALRCFFAQDYPSLELIVVDDGGDAVRDLLPDDPRVRYVRLGERMSVGAKRNLACREARGDVIVHCDDDDWYPPSRVSRQVAALRARGADVCGSSSIHFLDRARGEAYVYSFADRLWVAGTTLAYRRAFWESHPFRDVQVSEDTSFIWRNGPLKLVDLADPSLCVASIHAHNVSSKVMPGRYWYRVPLARVVALMGPSAQPDARLFRITDS